MKPCHDDAEQFEISTWGDLGAGVQQWVCGGCGNQYTVPTPEAEAARRGGISLRSALLQAEAHEAALTELYGRLRAEGHAYAYASAYRASEEVHSLVQQLREDVKHAPSPAECNLRSAL